MITMPDIPVYTKIGEGVKSLVFDIGNNRVLKQLKNSNRTDYKREYSLLKKLENFEVAPKPLFHYKNILIVEKIEGTTIADFVKTNAISTSLCEEIFNSIIFLVENDIIYADLHSKNVMLTVNNKLKFVDIDDFSLKRDKYLIPPFYFTVYTNLSFDNKFNNLTYEEFIQDFFAYCRKHMIKPEEKFEDFNLYF